MSPLIWLVFAADPFPEQQPAVPFSRARTAAARVKRQLLPGAHRQQVRGRGGTKTRTTRRRSRPRAQNPDLERSASMRRKKRSILSALSFDLGKDNNNPNGASPSTESFSLRRMSSLSGQRLRHSLFRGGRRKSSSGGSALDQSSRNREKRLAYISLSHRLVFHLLFMSGSS